MNFYDKLNIICQSKGVKITPTVLKCGGTKGIIGGWQKGASPNSDIIIKLSDYLNVSTDYLLGLDDIPNRKEISDLPEFTNLEKRCLSVLKVLTNEDKIEFIARMEQRAEDYSLADKEKYLKTV